MLEGLRGVIEPGAGRGVSVIPGMVGTDVALPGSHVLEPSSVEFIETPKGVRFERGGVGVAGKGWAPGSSIVHG